MSVCVYVCMYVCMYVWMDGWMDASGWMDGWMDACMHACMYVWSRVPCSRERELGGPYHWGGARDPGSGLISADPGRRKGECVREKEFMTQLPGKNKF